MTELILLALLFSQQQIAPTSSSGVVSGTISYSDGTPASGMMLRLTRIPDPGQQPPNAPGALTATDSKGVYRRRVAPGRYIIGAVAAEVIYYPGVRAEGEAQLVTVNAGSTVEGLNLFLPPSASGVRVQGRVRLPANYPTPMTSLRVEVPRAGRGTGIASDGTFEFTHVMPGTYMFSVTAPGAQPVTLTVADRDIAAIELRVPPLVAVQGSVALEEGNGPRPRFPLRIEGLLAAEASPGLIPYRTTVTAEPDGRFSATLPEGEYRLLINSLPSGYYLKSISTGTTDLVRNALKVAAADSPVRAVITLGTSPGVRITGRVTQSRVEGPSAVPEKILLTGLAVSDSVEAPVNPDGTFEFPRVMPGTYIARATLTPNISSAPVLVSVPNQAVAGIEIPVPVLREIFGKIAVDGNGPPPKFSLLLVRGKIPTESTGRSGELSSVPVAAIANVTLGSGSADTQVLQVDINARPDGSFRLKVPEGEYRVFAVPPSAPGRTGIPQAYFVRSLTSNSRDLTTESLRVSEEETPEMHIGFGTAAANPWVRVSGRVVGVDPAKGAYRVALESNVTSAIETYVEADGEFEFPAVLRGATYTVRMVPADEAASVPRIAVADKDVTGVQITVPARREITVRTTVEGNYPIPGFGLSFAGIGSSMMIVIRPESDGTLKVELPEDQRRVSIQGLPLGYIVKSLTYDSMDIRRQPLEIGASSAAAELKVMLAVDPAVPWGSLRGRVTGLDPDAGAVRLVLNSVTAFSTFETSVNADGSFSFQRIPQGTYVPSLEGAVAARLTAPIVVSGVELFGIEIAAPRPASNAQTSRVEEPLGATVSDFGLVGRAAANETAAVANLRTINTALITYLSANGGKYGRLEDLINAGLLDASFMETKAGFDYSILSIGSEYAAAALPANSTSGRFGFFSTPDAVIRYSTFEPLAPPQRGGSAVQ
jgi:hypothetical protein